MWLHKHGLAYYESKINYNYELLKERKSPGTFIRVKEFVAELLSDHLSNIASEMAKEDNFVNVMVQEIHKDYFAAKVANMQDLEPYETSLKKQMSLLKYQYDELKKKCEDLVSMDPKDEQGVLKTINNTAAVLNSLHDIERLSTELGGYLSIILPNMKKYEDWMKTRVKNAQWIEENIRSWIPDIEKNTKA